MLKRLFILLIILISFIPIVTLAKCQTFNPGSGVGCDSESNVYFCRGTCNSVAASSSLVTFCASEATTPNVSTAPGYDTSHAYNPVNNAPAFFCGIPEMCSTGYTLCRASGLSAAPNSTAGDWYDVRCKANFAPTSGQSGYVAGCSGYNTCTEKCSTCSSNSYCSSSNTCGPACVWPQSWDPTNCVCSGSAAILKLGSDSTSGTTGTNVTQSSRPVLFINNPNVGIGTSIPSTQFHIYHATSGPIISLSGTSTDNYRGLTIRDTSNIEKFFYGLDGFNNFVLRSSGSTDLLSTNVDTGNISINTTPSSATKFLINGTVNVDGNDALFSLGYLGTSTVDRLLVFKSDSSLYYSSLYVNDNQLAIGTSTFNGLLNVDGGAYISGSLVIGQNLTVTEKLTVKTIDPLYDIFGVKYSTFAPSVVGGVKEEIVGKININKKIGEEYQAIINFDKQPVGSDLWVWRHAVDFNKENIEVSLTPYGRFARTYYYIDDNSIILRSDSPVEVSYSFFGKRFDWRDWPTRAYDQSEKPSLIIR